MNVELPDELPDVHAEQLGVSPTDLARAALVDPDEAFRAASAWVLSKNEELYRRLA